MTALLFALAAWGQSLDYGFPTTAAHYSHWYPTAYYDHGGTTDWACGSTTYAGHRGNDFGAGSFAGMDAGRDITAAAPGVVIATHDGEFDRCTTAACGGAAGYGNYVRIAHTDGKQTVYGHLKTWSVAVAPGDFVDCGQVIGQMGSSGNSTGPHLHFTVHSPSGAYVDPFLGACSDPNTWWVSQGSHGALPSRDCGTYPDCQVAQVLTCGDTIQASNAGPGSTRRHEVYGCSQHRYSGPEIVYTVSSPIDEPIHLSLTGLGADLDMYLTEGTACDGRGCLMASHQPNLSDESLTLQAQAHVPYTLIIDGWQGAESDFTLTVDCDGLPPEPEDTAPPLDTAPPQDTGLAEDTAPPGDTSPPPPPRAPLTGSSPRVPSPNGWSCATAPGPGPALLPLLLLLGVRAERRRSAR